MIDIHLLHPNHLLYEAVGRPKISGTQILPEPILCGLCGLQTNEKVKWKITMNFSALDIFAEKENFQTLCPACIFTLNHLRDLHKGYLLTKVGFNVIQFEDQNEKKIKLGNIKVVNRYYFKELLLNPPTDEPWVLMFQSKMNAQHSLMKATVNYGEGDSLFISDGSNMYIIPREGLEELLNALEKIKLSSTLYPYLFLDKDPFVNHKDIDLWNEVAPIIYKHRHKDYLGFVYDRIIPPKKYMQDMLKIND